MVKLVGSRLYFKEFVREFYANLEQEINDPTRLKYHGVYVRGRIIEFSPKEINCFYVSGLDDDELVMPNMNVIVSTITCGKIGR